LPGKRRSASRRTKKTQAEYEFDVALSFAGEDRAYVEKVADALLSMGLKVFYDKYQEVSFWGKDLYVHLSEVYARRARFTVLFISKKYAEKVWTNHERRAAQSRAFSESQEVVLPARFDKTELPGLLPTVGYVSLRGLDPLKLAEMIKEKIGRFQRRNFFPKYPDRLVEQVLGAKTHKLAAKVADVGRHFFDQLGLMTESEREAVGLLLHRGCPHSLPRNMHIDLELLCRLIRQPREQVLALFERLDCLGFKTGLKVTKIHAGKRTLRHAFDELQLEFRPLQEGLIGNWTAVASAACVCIGQDFCDTHFRSYVKRLDFSSLSHATKLPERRGSNGVHIHP
jgi:hypothetical protein